MNDVYTLNQSYATTKRESVKWDVKKRSNFKVVDSQNGSYSGNYSSFDLSSISNSGLLLDWQSSEFVCPISIIVDRPQGTPFIEDNKFLACLKSNYALVDSMSLTLSGFPVISQQKMSSALIAYEMATNWTEDDYKRSSRFGMAFEDSTKFQVNTANSCYGMEGVSATSVLDFDPSASTFAEHLTGLKNATPNLGRKARCEQTYYADNADMNTLKDIGSVAKERRSYIKPFDANKPTQQVFNINARMSLAHLHSYFKNAPLSSNGLYRLEFYLNLAKKTEIKMAGGKTAFANATDKATAKVYSSISTTTSNQYNPLSLGSLATSDAMGAMEAAELDMSIVMKVGNDDETACFLNVALIELSVGAAEKYIENPVRTWEYDSHLFQDLPAVKANGTVQVQLSASMSRVRKIILLPYYTNSEGTDAPSDLLSPFNGIGASTLTGVGASITDLQCLISGVQLYQNQVTEVKDFYDMFRAHSLNGGVDTASINSSPVNMEQFMAGYGAIVLDCTKGQKESDFDLAKSYTLSFRNNTKKECRYLTYLIYSSVITQNIETGTIVL